MVNVERLAATIAAHGVPGAPDAFPSRPLDSTAWAALLALVDDGRVPGFLHEAVTDGALLVTDEQRHDVEERFAAARALVAHLERMLVDVVTLLEQHGIDHRVLKGPAVGNLDYPDPPVRTFGDVDLLVRGADLDHAVARLRDAGFRRRLPELRTGFERRFAKGVPLERAHGFELDLHRSFADGPFGLLARPEELFTGSPGSAQPFTVGGTAVRALSAEDRFVHACYHVALNGHRRLSSLRDVAQIALVTRPDETRVHARVRAWHGEPVLARGVARTWELLGLRERPPLVDWATAYHYSRGARRALGASVGADAGWPARALEGLRAVPGMAAKAAYARALLWPSAEFLAARGMRRGERWRAAARRGAGWLRLGRFEPRAGPGAAATRAGRPGPGGPSR